MSPLWRDELRLNIAPGEIRVSRWSRGVRPLCVGELVQGVVSSGLQCLPALTAIRELFSDARWHAPHARVVVSNLWARYAIVPWAAEVVTAEERASHARICLAATYGPLDESWTVSLSEAEPGKPRIACALPEGLVDGIKDSCAAHGTRVISLQPLLIASYNEWCHRLPDEGGWFVCVEDGALAAARLGSREWDRVYSARIGQDWSVELLRLKTFARMASSSGESGRVFVHGPPRLRSLAGVDASGLEWLGDVPRPAAGATVVRLPV